MAFYVPYVIDDAEHSARLFRRQFQQSVGEGSGVSRPEDLRVQALNTPGPGFRVGPGGAVIQSRDTAVSARESYGPINDAQVEVLGVAGTGSSGGRRDMVILEIVDPEMSSVVHDPVEAADLNYTRIRVVQGVPASAKTVADVPSLANVTAYALAAIQYPANVDTIQPSMITDLRKVQRPRTETAVRSMNLTGADKKYISSKTVYPAGGQTWPAQAEDIGIEIDIPSWATVVKIESTIYQAWVPSKGSAVGDFWVQMGASVHPQVRRTQSSRWDIDEQSLPHRTTIGLSDTISIPAQMRGTAQKFYPRANVTTGIGTGANPNTLGADWATSFNLTAVFEEVRD